MKAAIINALSGKQGTIDMKEYTEYNTSESWPDELVPYSFVPTVLLHTSSESVDNFINTECEPMEKFTKLDYDNYRDCEFILLSGWQYNWIVLRRIDGLFQDVLAYPETILE